MYVYTWKPTGMYPLSSSIIECFPSLRTGVTCSLFKHIYMVGRFGWQYLNLMEVGVVLAVCFSILLAVVLKE